MELQELLNKPEAPYIIGGAIAVASSFFGYIGGRLSSKKRFEYATMQHKERLSELELEKEKARVTLEQEKNRAELTKLEYEEKERQYQRDKELGEINHQRELLIENRKRQEQEKERAYKSAVLETIVKELSPIIKPYLEKVESEENTINEEWLNERCNFRKKLVEDYFRLLQENDDYEIYNEEFDIGEEDLERISRIVDAHYPLSDNSDAKLHPKVEKLIEQISQYLPDFTSQV